ncbi:MAG: AbrB/MazE/SpoVT family DNA-binding domain-containing protein [Candidatus Parabeggiatoa sp.]|nr:AbrB/MazE/SpoVT family DNA-binding domain-containing protein [Candidatus Parabeggiatoa sp.]
MSQTSQQESLMITTEVFQSGISQLVKLPKAFHFNTNIVGIRRQGNEVIITPLPKTHLEEAFYALTGLSDDFMAEGRQQLSIQTREDF